MEVLIVENIPVTTVLQSAASRALVPRSSWLRRSPLVAHALDSLMSAHAVDSLMRKTGDHLQSNHTPVCLFEPCFHCFLSFLSDVNVEEHSLQDISQELEELAEKLSQRYDGVCFLKGVLLEFREGEMI